MNKVKKAIIMAAGFGSRMQPLTFKTPKPLIKVNGKRMIETVIEGLHENGITEIYVVVGYLEEQFKYLEEKYSQLKLITNPYYDTANNISSLYVASNVLDDATIILDGDQIIKNSQILQAEFDYSGYSCSKVNGETDEWVLQLDSHDVITSCNRNGGKDGWRLYSISRWTKDDAISLKKQIQYEFNENNTRDVYWDDIPMFYYFEKYKLKGYKISATDIEEVDSLTELVQIDSSYQEVIEDEK